MEMTSKPLGRSARAATGEAKGEPPTDARHHVRKTSPAFSPDGKRVAYHKFAMGKQS